MRTISIIITFLVTLMPNVAGANEYETKLNDAFECIINAAKFSSFNEVHNYYSDPETGSREGKLDLVEFALPAESIYLINAAKGVYEQINRNSGSDWILNNELYTLWMNNGNKERNYSGYRLYYSPKHTILVGKDTENGYTAGFVSPEDKKHRTTYTLEWNEGDDSIRGRIITTYAPIKSKSNSNSYILELDSLGIHFSDSEFDMEKFESAMEKYQKGMEKYQAAMEKAQGALSDELPKYLGHSFSFSSSSSSSSNHRNAKNWMKQLLRYLYLSKLYDLCKDTDGLDETDLKIAMQQLASVYKQLKSKSKLKENELLFLESMVDLLENKTKSIHSWNPD